MSNKLDARDLEGQPFIEAAHFEKRYNCIFCVDDKYHMYVSEKKGLFHCFKCETAGKLIQREKVGLSNFQEKLDTYQWGPVSTKEECRMEAIKTLPRCKEVEYETPADLYLSTRNLDRLEIARLKIQESLDTTGIYSNTIIFPIWDKKDRLEYFVCRKIDGTDPKYVNAPWDKGSTTYYLSSYTNSCIRGILICEGVFDAIVSWKAKMLHTHALLGKKATTKQLEKIVNQAITEDIPIVVCLDHDAFGYAVKLKLELKMMGQHMGRMLDIKLFHLQPGMDPGKMDPYIFGRLLKKCVSSHPQ